jgi:hypothetical protein
MRKRKTYAEIRAEIETAVHGAYREGYAAGERDGKAAAQREYSNYGTAKMLAEDAVAKIVGKAAS